MSLLFTSIAQADAAYDKFEKSEGTRFRGDDRKCQNIKKSVDSKSYLLCSDNRGKPVRIDEVDPMTEEGGIDVFLFRDGTLVSRCDPDHVECVGFKNGAAVVSWNMASKSVTRSNQDQESQDIWLKGR